MKQDTNGVNEVGIAEVCTINVDVSINIMYFLTTEALDKHWLVIKSYPGLLDFYDGGF